MDRSIHRTSLQDGGGAGRATAGFRAPPLAAVPFALRRTLPRPEAASLPRTVRRGCPRPQKTLYQSPPSRDLKTGGEAAGPCGCPSTTVPRATSGLVGALNTGPDSLGSGPQFARRSWAARSDQPDPVDARP